MKKVLIISVFLISSLGLYSTTQAPDYLIMDDTKYKIHSNPLESFFKLNTHLRPPWRSTALWRAYIATFKVFDNQLYLIDISVEDVNLENRHEYRLKSVMYDIFPHKEKVLLSWYSGILVLPVGDRIKSVNMGYASTYEKYILLAIEDGAINEIREYNTKEFEKFKKAQFREFQQTDKYRELYDKYISREDDKEKVVRFLYVYLTDYTSEFLVDLPEE